MQDSSPKNKSIDDIVKKHAKDLRKLKDQVKDQAKEMEQYKEMADALNILSEQDKQRIEELSNAIEELNNVNQSIQQDFRNYRRRTEEEGAVKRSEGKIEAAIKIVPVADIVYSALSMITDQKVAEGVAMIARRIERVLQELDIYEIESKDKPFDPTYHEAISVIDVINPEQDGIVIRVLQKGYIMKDRVLRHSQVQVGRLLSG